MATKRSRQFDELDSHRAKRRLVESMSYLSLGNLSPVIEPEYNTPDSSEMMDTGGPDTVFIPSIDQFLDDDESMAAANLFGDLFKIPDAVLKQSSALVPLHQRPSMALIRYEPKELVIWRHLYRHVLQPVQKMQTMDVDSEDCDLLDQDGQEMDLD